MAPSTPTMNRTASNKRNRKKAALVPTKTIRICTNCRTNTTSMWRFDSSEQLLCNACHQYEKKMKKSRPAEMRSDSVKRRMGSTSMPYTGMMFQWNIHHDTVEAEIDHHVTGNEGCSDNPEDHCSGDDSVSISSVLVEAASSILDNEDRRILSDSEELNMDKYTEVSYTDNDKNMEGLVDGAEADIEDDQKQREDFNKENRANIQESVKSPNLTTFSSPDNDAYQLQYGGYDTEVAGGRSSSSSSEFDDTLSFFNIGVKEKIESTADSMNSVNLSDAVQYAMSTFLNLPDSASTSATATVPEQPATPTTQMSPTQLAEMYRTIATMKIQFVQLKLETCKLQLQKRGTRTVKDPITGQVYPTNENIMEQAAMYAVITIQSEYLQRLQQLKEKILKERVAAMSAAPVTNQFLSQSR